MIDVDSLPREIIESTRAVCWRSVQRDGKATKVPFQPECPTSEAKVNDPRTWGAFRTALVVALDGRADGVGFVLGDGLVGVDLDHCRVASAITDDALAIVRMLDSYTERSPSGTGLHVLARGTLPPGRRKAGDVEMYCDGRFFTVTGAHVAGTPTTIEERTDALAALHARIFPPTIAPSLPPAPPLRESGDDATLLERAHQARNGAKFAALWRGDIAGYASGSEADLALCSLLAFWTGNDAARVDRLFRQSGLMRGKWDIARGAETYGARTIACALAGRR